MTTTRTPATARTVDSPLPGAYLIRHCYESPDGDLVVHRTDGPAIIGAYPDDNADHLDVDWRDHGHDHRLDGPAATTSDGGICWDVDGSDITHLLEQKRHDW